MKRLVASVPAISFGARRERFNTTALGLPTASDDAEYMMQLLAQDRQLG